MKKALAYILSLCLLLSAPVYAHTADLPFASIPNTPPGMQACSIEDFVYFIWDDWSEFESDHSMKKAINKAYHPNANAPDQICVSYINGYDTDQYDPESFMALMLYIIIMSYTEAGNELPVIEKALLRDTEGMMLYEDGTVMWMFQHGNAAVFIMLEVSGLSGPECCSKLLQVLGVTEDDIKILTVADTELP